MGWGKGNGTGGGGVAERREGGDAIVVGVWVAAALTGDVARDGCERRLQSDGGGNRKPGGEDNGEKMAKKGREKR